MENCKSCIFYDSDYDELRQSGNDVRIIGQEDIEKHYCIMYDGHIDPAIIDGERQCEHFIPKD